MPSHCPGVRCGSAFCGVGLVGWGSVWGLDGWLGGQQSCGVKRALDIPECFSGSVFVMFEVHCTWLSIAAPF